ncbi:enhancer of mRNA decapping [Myotisia sp. PD_48]|nr:enhancer of mRNA decapping [Myotisia sp. PD_48]
MASQFVGCAVLVTLKSPPNYQVQGEVVDVVGSRLSLQNVTLLWTGQHLPLYHIEAPGIADLEVIAPTAPNTGENNSSDAHNRPYFDPQHQSQHQPPTSQPFADKGPQNQSQPFLDPAILSFKRPSEQNEGRDALTDVNSSSVYPAPPSPVMIGDSELSNSLYASHSTLGHKKGGVSEAPGAAAAAAAATLSAPFNDMDINSGNTFPAIRTDQPDTGVQAHDSLCSAATPVKQPKRRTRRGGKGKDTATQATDTIEHIDAGNKRPKGKGWRQTAFVEPVHTETVHTSKSQIRTSRKSRNTRQEQSGWATEDATDIQEMGDFDFQSNLSKFDKRRVFDEIRNDDTTLPEHRLASFNRRARPGTNGGKNLHYTENVLDPPSHVSARWNSEAGETDDDGLVDGQFPEEPVSSRNRSRTSARPPSRKDSVAIGSTPSSSHLSGRGHLASVRTASPRPHKSAPHSAASITGSSGSAGWHLQIVTTGRPCPTVSPLQMLEVEQLAISELGLTDDIITENAGRGIAEGSISLVTELRASSTVIVFAGNHRTGSRAIAAARHLRNRGYRVTLCILGSDRENEFADGFQRQVEIFQRSGGRMMRWEELSTRLASANYVPDLVVEGLFGMHVSFEDLRTDDQATAFEIISWANRSNVKILSVDIPSGISAVTGLSSISQGSKLAILSHYIICLGAPKSGLLNALISGEENGLWQMAVADVGISQAAWRKYGTRRRHGVEFGNMWVVPLRFQPPTP